MQVQVLSSVPTECDVVHRIFSLSRNATLLRRWWLVPFARFCQILRAWLPLCSWSSVPKKLRRQVCRLFLSVDGLATITNCRQTLFATCTLQLTLRYYARFSRYKSCHPYQRNAMLYIAFFRCHETQHCCAVGGSSPSHGFAKYFVLGSPFARGHPYQKN